MHSPQSLKLSSITSVASLIAYTLATPTPSPKSTTFSIKQVSTGRHINPYADVAKVYHRYNGTIPDHIIKPAAVLDDIQIRGYEYGGVEADPATPADGEYVCPVSIGTPGQSVSLIFDTGSSMFWTFSDLPTNYDTTGHALYSPSSSSTSSQIQDASWATQYGGGGSASGVIYTDTVTIAGITAPMSVGAATTVPGPMDSNGAEDGIVGLGWSNAGSACSPNPCMTWMETVWSYLQEPVFTSYLHYHAAGEYDFGYVDGNKYTGDIAYVDVDPSNGFWEFQIASWQIDEYSPSYTYSYTYEPLTAIADTGTSLLYLPDDICNAYYADVPGATTDTPSGLWEFPCDSSIPALTLGIGAGYFSVPAEFLTFKVGGDGNCVGGLQSSGDKVYNILGAVFLKAVFVVWDFGSTRIGFAAQA